MKKIMTFVLTCLLLTAILVSCNQADAPAETTPGTGVVTEAATENSTQAPAEDKTEAATVAEEITDAVTEAPTAAPVDTAETLAEAVTDGAEEPTDTALSDETATEDPDANLGEDTNEELTVPVEETEAVTEEEVVELPYDVMSIPVASYGDLELEGYLASGSFTFDDEFGCVYSDDVNNMLVVTNDSMTSGKLTATFLSSYGDVNDNGIIFGLEDPVGDQYEFWEDGPAYYFLFVSDIQHLYLAKAGYNGQPWTELYVTPMPIPEYTHGENEITISVEFDGEGEILCYANDELLIDYYDFDPLKGDNYGIRCEVLGVEYYNVVAEHE